MDSDSDEEIFFGPVTAKEEKVSSQIKNRRTENFQPGVALFRRRSSRPSLASLEEEEGKICDSDSTTSLVVHSDSTYSNLSLGDRQGSLCEGSVDNISSQSSDLIETEVSTDVSSLSAPDSLQNDDKVLFVFTSRSSTKVTTEVCETEVEITQSNLESYESNESHSNTQQDVNIASGAEESHESIDSALHSGSCSRTSEEELFDRNEERQETVKKENLECDVAPSEADIKIQVGIQEKIEVSSEAVEMSVETEENICTQETNPGASHDIVMENELSTNVQVAVVSSSDIFNVDGLPIEEKIDECKESENIQDNQEEAIHENLEEVVQNIEISSGEYDKLSASKTNEEDHATVACETEENSNYEKDLSRSKASEHPEEVAQEEQLDTDVKKEQVDEDETSSNGLVIFDLEDHAKEISNKSDVDSQDELPHAKRLIKPRMSYYSSLEVINVNETNIYDGFITEESNDSSHDLEQVIHATDEFISLHPAEQKRRSKMYSSSTCETFSEGSDSVFGSEAPKSGSNHTSLSDMPSCTVSGQKNSYRVSASDVSGDSVFIDNDDIDPDFNHEAQIIMNNSSDSDDNISPVTPPPKVPVKIKDSHLKQIFTVTPPPSSIPALQKIPLDADAPFSPAPLSYLSSSHSLGDSGAESYGSVNRAMILSQSVGSEPKSFVSQPAACQSPVDSEVQYHSPYSDAGDTQKYLSPVSQSQCRSGWTTYHTAKENLDISSDSCSDNESSSPERRFNDTIEEMEMMLKYGLNYGEKDNEGSNDIKEENSAYDVLEGYEERKSDSIPMVEDCDGDYESIVSPRKTSVASTISNFQPNMDSTRSSSLREDVMKSKVAIQSPELFEGSRVHSPLMVNKKQKEAPPKPPRNPTSQYINSFKSQTDGNTASRLGNTNKPKPSPLSLTPKIIKSGTPKNIVAKLPVVRPTNDTGLIRSNSLTNIYKTSRADQSPANTPIRSVTGFRSQQNSPLVKAIIPPKKYSPSDSSLKLNSGRPGLPPRVPIGRVPSHKANPVYQNTVQTKFSTPQAQKIRSKIQVSSASKILSPSMKNTNNLKFKQGLGIVSPVAKYLKENPPPPLVVNVKPRHKISPVKIQSEIKSKRSPLTTSQNSPQRRLHGEDTQALHRDAALNRIQGDLDKLTSKMKTSRIECDEEEVSDSEDVVRGRVLPKAVYTSAPAIVDLIENKENERIRKRREIVTDKQPVLVLKHKGRVKVPKVTFKEGLVDSSPKGRKSPSCLSPAVSSLKGRSSLRNSLMEVSLYESHETQYTNTLQK